MRRRFRLLAIVVATVAGAGLASCSSDAPTDPGRGDALIGLFGSTGDSIPGDSIPNDTIPNDSIPNDTIPNDTIPNDTIPNDTIPNDTIPNDTIPPDTLVHRFNLLVTVVAADSTGDTLHAVRVSGARVTVHRYPSTPDSSDAPNAVFRTGRTGRNGNVLFAGLPSAWYRIEVHPPPQGPYLEWAALVAPATSVHVPLQVLLPRKP